MASFAARSAFRSARNASARFSSGARPRPAPSPFRFSSQSSISARTFRSPVELGAVVSLMPYHSATASALLTSMLSIDPRSCAWTIEGPERTRRRF